VEYSERRTKVKGDKKSTRPYSNYRIPQVTKEGHPESSGGSSLHSEGGVGGELNGSPLYGERDQKGRDRESVILEKGAYIDLKKKLKKKTNWVKRGENASKEKSLFLSLRGCSIEGV